MADAMNEWIEECRTDQECYETGTGWSFIWAWNGAWCILMSFNFILLAIGAFLWWPRLVGTLLNYLLCTCHLVGIITMFFGVYSPFPRVCQYNKASSTYDGGYKWTWDSATYEGDFGLMYGMSITMAINWCIQVCFCCLPLYMTPIEKGKPEEGIPVESSSTVKVKQIKKDEYDNENDSSQIVLDPPSSQNKTKEPSQYPDLSSFSEEAKLRC